MSDKERFQIWFYNANPPGFWQRYTQRYLGTVNKGSPSKALEAARRSMIKAIKAPTLDGLPKIDSEEDFMKACDLALEAQKLYFDEATKYGKFVPNFKMVATWFNQCGWEFPVPEHSTLKSTQGKIGGQSFKPGKVNSGKVVDIEKAKQYKAEALKKLGIKRG